MRDPRIYNPFDQVYTEFLARVMFEGEHRMDRTSVGTTALFCPPPMRFDLSKGRFPLLTTKKIHFRSVVEELLFFLRGDTNNKILNAKGVTIWNEWAGSDGALGPIYGAQWRNFGGGQISDGRPDGRGVDQLANVISELRVNPTSRRLVVSAWNPVDIPRMALPPCHVMFQFGVFDGRLCLHLTQRSGDAFLGIPFNIASYSLLLILVAREVNLPVGEFVHTVVDAHVYDNHRTQVAELLDRNPFSPPSVSVRAGSGGIFALTRGDIILDEYISHPSIYAPVAV